ncbi:DUF4168 domain-containing protein [Desulfurispira natronophila]|uniref:Spy/CpxP family protein refolding chaperone n=1 Tax=Desulfurispira natronophila TaxID=682562 RepID=A0A7W7Y5U6_9BACT|nr:DUF4168 domain-containing protein [Desulfurispira natronophila]MBB5022464.1 Spy/CpxP family protein refolding chaperone [Desulfurispira natronophila]
MRKKISAMIMTLALIMAAFFIGITPASAQQMPGQPEVEVRDVSNSEVEQVAGAYVEISAIQESYQQRLSNVQDPQEAQKLQQQANEEMTEVVENSGISVDQYNEIMLMAQMDEDIRFRILEEIEEMQ